MLLGYACVSTTEQETAAQVVALKTAADAAQLFKVHPATVSHLLTQATLRTLRSQRQAAVRRRRICQIAPKEVRQIIQKVTRAGVQSK